MKQLKLLIINMNTIYKKGNILVIPSKTNRKGNPFNIDDEYKSRKSYKKCMSECFFKN